MVQYSELISCHKHILIVYLQKYTINFNERINFLFRVLTFAKPESKAVRAVTHYYTRAWPNVKTRKRMLYRYCFILPAG